MSERRANILIRIADSIDRHELPLALAVEIETGGLKRAWNRTKDSYLLFELLKRTVPKRMKMHRWARSAAYFAGVNKLEVKSFLVDRGPIPDYVKDLRPSSAWFWAWNIIKRASARHPEHWNNVPDRVIPDPAAQDYYDLFRANVPDDFVLESMLRPLGPPTMAEISAAAKRPT